ncbi:GntR family transcriptional regulator [Consotaella aegiceratis]|uniref:GntR family transcriptional regulator n=1 Tax=Consotaella aegiceratis TaxID=3097961 RepID=UPI002F420886
MSVNAKDSAENADDLPIFEAQRVGAQAQPLYQAVKRQISDAIMLGRWPAGTVLPNEIDLAHSFGVAVGTLRRALADLTKEGMLSRRRKTGTIVTGRTPQHSLRFFFQYFRLHGRDGSLQHSEAEVTSLLRSAASVEECAKLRLEDGVEVVRLQRTRRVGGIPVMHDTFSLPAVRIPDFPEDPAAVPALLYLYLLDRYGIRISAVREQISAVLAEEADARLLGIGLPSALLHIEEIAYDQAGQPMIHAVHRCTTANHRYVNEVQ